MKWFDEILMCLSETLKRSWKIKFNTCPFFVISFIYVFKSEKFYWIPSSFSVLFKLYVSSLSLVYRRMYLFSHPTLLRSGIGCKKRWFSKRRLIAHWVRIRIPHSITITLPTTVETWTWRTYITKTPRVPFRGRRKCIRRTFWTVLTVFPVVGTHTEYSLVNRFSSINFHLKILVLGLYTVLLSNNLVLRNNNKTQNVNDSITTTRKLKILFLQKSHTSYYSLELRNLI